MKAKIHKAILSKPISYTDLKQGEYAVMGYQEPVIASYAVENGKLKNPLDETDPNFTHRIVVLGSGTTYSSKNSGKEWTQKVRKLLPGSKIVITI